MKNRLTFSQVAEIYCKELNVEVPQMEEYLRAVFNDAPTDDIEDRIRGTLKNTYDRKSEFFPEYNEPSAELLRGPIKKKVLIMKEP